MGTIFLAFEEDLRKGKIILKKLDGSDEMCYFVRLREVSDRKPDVFIRCRNDFEEKLYKYSSKMNNLYKRIVRENITFSKSISQEVDEYLMFLEENEIKFEKNHTGNPSAGQSLFKTYEFLCKEHSAGRIRLIQYIEK